MYRTRMITMPRIPHSTEEVNLLALWRVNLRGEQFLLYQDNDWGLLLFSTNDNMITYLTAQLYIYIDGTFKTTPRPYNLVIIHGRYYGRVLSFVMVLSAGKTVGHYKQILQTIKLPFK
jgi:hypothetical protein